MMRSEEYHQGDGVVYGFPRSPKCGWSHGGAGRWWKIEELPIWQNQPIDFAVSGPPKIPGAERCSEVALALATQFGLNFLISFWDDVLCFIFSSRVSRVLF